MKHSMVWGAVAALVAGPVLAGNLEEAPIEPIPAAPVATPVVTFTAPDWTGGYVGAQLGYGTAGAAFADADLGDDTGYLVGAGVTQRLTDRLLLGGEVLYHGFDDYDDTDIDVNATTATARLSFEF